MLSSLHSGVRGIVRVFIRSPWLSITALLMFTAGTAAAVCVFSVVDALLFRSLGVIEPSTFVRLDSHDHKGHTRLFSYSEFRALEERQTDVRELFAWVAPAVTVSWGAKNETVGAFLVSSNAFNAMGITMSAGRQFNTAPSSENDGVVLTYAYWQRKFSGDDAVIGRPIRIDDKMYVVTGITRREFSGLLPGVPCDLIMPLGHLFRSGTDRTLLTAPVQWLQISGRLRDGVTMERASAEVGTSWPSIIKMTSGASKGDMPPSTISVERGAAGTSIYQQQFADSLYAISVVTGLVLVCICVTIATLLMVRVAEQEPEVAIRLALGEQPVRIVLRSLSEILLLAFTGSLAGVAVGIWASHRLVAFWSSGPARVALDVRIDQRLVGFVVLLCLCCGVMSGLGPAVYSIRGALSSGMQLANKRSTWSGGRLMTVLVSIQIASSIPLLSSAAMFIQSMRNLRQQQVGFQPEKVVSFSLRPSRGYDATKDMTAYYSTLRETIQTVPGVHSVAIGSSIPTGYWSRTLVNTGSNGEKGNRYSWGCASPGYFSTLHTRVVAGREFNQLDGAGARKVAIINESLAMSDYRGGIALNRLIGVGENRPLDTVIVGIVQDRGFRGFREADGPAVYIPCSQRSRQGYDKLIVSTAVSPGAVIPIIEKHVQGLGIEEAINGMTLLEQIDMSLVREKTVASVATVFGGIASALTGIGLYALLMYVVQRRRREIGIRIALGSQKAQIIGWLCERLGVLVVVGVLIGIPAGVGVGYYARSLLFGIAPTSVLLITQVTTLFALIIGVAAIVPALRASSVDPMEVLRGE
jgi:putative ABC transport system permease protein